MAKVIFTSKFINNQWHVGDLDLLDYFERPQAFQPKKPDKVSEYDLYSYMGNREKSDGIFTADKDHLEKKDINELRELERHSMDVGCPKYIQVVSFENSFLEENHILVNGVLDKDKLRSTFRKAMGNLIESEPKFEPDNCYWSAAIHLNTDNIHIHCALLERERLEDRVKKYRDGDMISVGAMNKLKSTIARELIETNDRTREHTRIERELLLPYLKKQFTNVIPQMIELRKALPKEGAWQYNRPKMKKYREQIDNVVDCVIQSNDNLKKLFSEYKGSLDALSEHYKDFYGEGVTEQYMRYTTNKLNDFYTRAGNSLLQALSKIELADKNFKTLDDSSEFVKNKELYQQYRLGRRYLSEKENLSKGIELLKQNAENGHAQSQFALGKHYLDNGRMRYAYNYLKAAAEQENSFAYYQLGRYHNIRGEYAQSMYCFRKSSELGNEYAKQYLEKRMTRRRTYRSNATPSTAKIRYNRAAAQMRSAAHALDSLYHQAEAHLKQLQREFEYENDIASYEEFEERTY